MSSQEYFPHNQNEKSYPDENGVSNIWEMITEDFQNSSNSTNYNFSPEFTIDKKDVENLMKTDSPLFGTQMQKNIDNVLLSKGKAYGSQQENPPKTLVRKIKKYEQGPLSDKNEEKKRINAIKAKERRDHQKDKKISLDKELKKIKEEIDHLHSEKKQWQEIDKLDEFRYNKLKEDNKFFQEILRNAMIAIKK